MVRLSLAWLVLVGVVCSGSSFAWAQDEVPGAIRIGTSQPQLAKCVAMLVDQEVRTATLLGSHDFAAWLRTGDLPSYQVINRKAIQLRSCSVYFSQADRSVPCDAIWRERLGRYGTPVIEIPGSTTDADMIFLANELAELFPEKREEIHARLNELLERQRRTQAKGELAVYRFD